VHLVPPSQRLARCAFARADFRLVVRFLSRRHHPGARVGWKAAPEAERSGCGPTGRCSKWRPSATRRPRPPLRRAGRGRGGVPLRQYQDGLRRQDRRHHRGPREPGRRAAPRFRRDSSPWCSPAYTRWNPTSTACCATRSKKLRLNDSAFNFDPNTPWRWVSVSAADFWAAAPGNRPGAPRARVRHRPHHHRAWRAVPRHQHGRRSHRSDQPHQVPRPFRDSSRSKSPSSTPP